MKPSKFIDKEGLSEDLVFLPGGEKIDNTIKTNLNIEKGVFAGIGYSLTSPRESQLQQIYLDWKGLNSHKLTLGTTRQGKSRLMVADLEQQIIKGHNIVIEEPKGSEDQEMIGYAMELLRKHKRLQDYRYVSPYYHEYSEWFNPIYGYKNEQISSMVADIIQAKDEFYANIAKTIVLCSTLGLELLEKYNDYFNPYDKIIMSKIEYAKAATKKTNRINRYMWGSEFETLRHGVEFDVITDLKRDKSREEIQLIDEALHRTELRYNGALIDEVEPLRTFITLRDLAQFETIESLQMLKEKVRVAHEKILENPKLAHLKKLSSEALSELSKASSRDAGFFSKVSTTYSTVMSDLITGDVGIILNNSRINRLADDMTSSERGIVVIVQPFPMIYKSASDAIGKILFYMINSIAGYVGASGKMLSRRLDVNIDEAGSVLTYITREIANKGGGLGFSLYLYTQSIADIEDTLGPEGARILMDNMNTKAIFKGNDTTSLETISTMLGTKKQGGVGAMGGTARDSKLNVRAEEVELATASILSQLDARKYLLKHGSEIYFVSAPFVGDTKFKILMPVKSASEISKESDAKIDEYKKSLERFTQL